MIHSLEFVVSQPLFGPSTRAFGAAQDEGIRFNLILRWPEGPSKDGYCEQKCELQKR